MTVVAIADRGQFATVLSNRGCRAQCTFCSVRNFNGVSVRQRSVESVLDELELLKDRYGIGHFVWLDDDLLKDHRRAKPATAVSEPATTAVRSNGVAKIKRFKMRPMSDEQAREQMDELGHTFFLFLNEDSQELNLLYRRHDGTLGLLEADLL